MSIPSTPVKYPWLVTTRSYPKWQEQTVARFYDDSTMTIEDNDRYNEGGDICMGGHVNPPLMSLVETEGEYGVRWIIQEVDHYSSGFTLHLESLQADYHGQDSVLCRSADPSLECTYYFNQPFQRNPTQVPALDSPVLCFSGYADRGDFWRFDTTLRWASPDAFALKIEDDDAERTVVFTYAMVGDKLVPCDGNGFEKMIYAVLGSWNPVGRSCLCIDVHGIA